MSKLPYYRAVQGRIINMRGMQRTTEFFWSAGFVKYNFSMIITAVAVELIEEEKSTALGN